MVVRYGDFVLYRPPVKGITLLLWGGPIALMLLGFFVLQRYLRQRARASMLKTSRSRPTKPAAPMRCSRNSTRNDPVRHFRHPADRGGRRLHLAAAVAGPARPQTTRRPAARKPIWPFSATSWPNWNVKEVEGTLADGDFEQAKRELQRRLLEEVEPECRRRTPEASAWPEPQDGDRLLFLLPVLAVGYGLLGNPKALDPAQTARRPR
jgi:hypothetical protein